MIDNQGMNHSFQPRQTNQSWEPQKHLGSICIILNQSLLVRFSREQPHTDKELVPLRSDVLAMHSRTSPSREPHRQTNASYRKANIANRTDTLPLTNKTNQPHTDGKNFISKPVVCGGRKLQSPLNSPLRSSPLRKHVYGIKYESPKRQPSKGEIFAPNHCFRQSGTAPRYISNPSWNCHLWKRSIRSST